jgi:hypothetical protein
MDSLILVNGDTDSIMVGKKTGEPFSSDEQNKLLAELNSHFPETISWEADGYFPTAIIFAAKNYALYDGKKIKTKGSALRDQKKEPALRKFLDQIIKSIIEEKADFKEIYDLYAKEIMNLKDIKPWSAKRTYTEKVDSSKRANETKVKDALNGSDYKPGDKFYVFYLPNRELCLAEKFTGEYDQMKLLKRLYDTSKVFDSVLPIE